MIEKNTWFNAIFNRGRELSMVPFPRFWFFLSCSGLFLYCGLIYWLSDQPYIDVPQVMDNQDKVHHFIAYSIMGGLAASAIWHMPARQVDHWVSVTKPWRLAVLFCALFGISDEIHQAFVAGRTSDVYDWVFDCLGAGFGSYVVLRTKRTIGIA